MTDNEIKKAIPNEDDVYWVELDDIYKVVNEMETNLQARQLQ